MVTAFFQDVLQAISERGRLLLSPQPETIQREPIEDILAWCERLLSGKGEASGMAIARNVVEQWDNLSQEHRLAFMLRLNRDFGPSLDRLETAIDEYRKQPDYRTLNALHDAAEPRRQELIRRLNLTPGGITALVSMRESLLAMKRTHKELQATDSDFRHLFSSWFNRGFLVLRPIDWTTPAHILEKIIRYEAVHEIRGWDDLRRRLEPKDRRCFAFFHPQLSDEPLIFVEVALTSGIPDSIGDLLAEDRPHLKEDQANTAVFYSISNCQAGLAGVSFGNFLIKQVVDILGQQLPNVATFVTLSPVPGFAGWIAQQRSEPDGVFAGEDPTIVALLDDTDWHQSEPARQKLEPVLMRAATIYLSEAKSGGNKPLDPVARFHLGNGARLERINVLGDVSPNGMRQAHGLMVNYLYKLDEIEVNHERFAKDGTVSMSEAVRCQLRKPTASGRSKTRQTPSASLA